MFKGNLAQGPLRATALQVSTTAIGQTIPITYGYDRTDGRLIYWSNFISHGGGSGFFGSGASGTTYSANVDLLMGYGPMEGVSDLWANGSWTFVYSDIYSFTPGAVTGGQTVNWSIPMSTSVNPNGNGIVLVAGVYISNVPYSASYNDYVFPGVTNSFTLSGTGVIPLNNAQFPAPNNKSYVNGSIPYAYYNSVYTIHTGSVVFPVAMSAPYINVVYYFCQHNDKPNPIVSLGLAWEAQLGSGSSGQPVVYPEFSGASGANVNLGGSPVFPQIQFHVKGLYGNGWDSSQGSMAGWTSDPYPIQMPAAGDCNVADIMMDVICSGNNVGLFGTNAVWNHGACFNNIVYDGTGGYGNILQFSRYGGIVIDENTGLGLNKVRNYSHAYTIYISGTVTDQISCAQVLTELAEIANAAPVWNGASLDFIPYCEVSNYGNGASYVAPTAAGPSFNLGYSHFKVTPTKKGSTADKSPLIGDGGVPKDNFNSLALNFKDRTGQTNNNMILVSDAYDISRQGQMPQGSRSFNWIQHPLVAAPVAWAILRRNIQITRHGTYSFDLPACWSPILSLMDFVTLNDTYLSPFPVPVRIIKIDENEDFSLAIEAERFVYGASAPVAPGTANVAVSSGGSGSGGNGSQEAGSVNTPIIFEAIPAISSQQQLWLCVSGSPTTTGAVTGATVTNPGSYTVAPSVTITGDGSGATAAAILNGSGGVASIFIITPGVGYTHASIVFGSGTAAATAIINNINLPYGGCYVMLSTDGGATYNYINGSAASSVIYGSQIMGLVYNSNYPSHVDPDAADTLYVDLTESGGALPAYSTAQRDAFVSLCYMAGGGTITGSGGTTLTIPYELISYSQSSLQATNKYASNTPPGSSTQIRRGVYTTPVAAHNIGTQFSFLEDGNVFKWNLPSTLVGVTLYFKFLAFNTVGGTVQPLSSATAYSFTPTGLVGWGQITYTISPVPSVYQGQASGWAGVDTNSSTWTNTNDVYFPPLTATFSNGKVLNYAARDSGLAVFSGSGQTAWVTIYDPTQIGEPSGVATLTAYADLNQTRWNTPGYTRVGTLTSGSGSSGGGGGSGSSGPYFISSFEGDPTLTRPIASQILLSHVIPGNLTNVVLPVGLAGSRAICKAAPTGAVTITIKQNGTTRGTINFAASATTATFSFTSAVTLLPGDIVDFIYQAGSDLTFAGVSWSLAGTRS